MTVLHALSSYLTGIIKSAHVRRLIALTLFSMLFSPCNPLSKSLFSGLDHFHRSSSCIVRDRVRTNIALGYDQSLTVSNIFSFGNPPSLTRSNNGGATDRSEEVERPAVGQNERTTVQRGESDPRLVAVVENSAEEVHQFTRSSGKCQRPTVWHNHDDPVDQVHVCGWRAGQP